MFIPRLIDSTIRRDLKSFPVVAIVGPRQSGKSTLAQHIIGDQDNLFLDLELPTDLEKLSDPQTFLEQQKGRLICIDEIQHAPELFSLIRALVDRWKTPGSFLVLGSASRDLLKQSSQTLAGRIAYNTLLPFLFSEVCEKVSFETYIERGGFPLSLLADDDELSMRWRQNFMRTFLERDLIQWSGASPSSMRRLWSMLAHLNGQTANYSVLGSSLGVTSKTVKTHIDLLASTFMVEVVGPYRSNLGKRLVKAPKVYIADSGITCALLNINSYRNLVGHPAYGAIWEQVVLTTIRGHFPDAEISFYRSSGGAEIDFVVDVAGDIFAIECKASIAPKLTRGNNSAIEDIKPQQTLVVAPIDAGWPMKENISAVSLSELISRLQA